MWDENGNWIKRSRKKNRLGRAVQVTEETLLAPEGRFPRFRDVLPTFSSGEHLTVALDPEMLMDLATAMGRCDERKAITLFIPISKKVIEDTDGNVTAELPFCEGAIAAFLNHPDKGTAIGVLMPCSCSPADGREVYQKFVESLGPTPIDPPPAPVLEEDQTEETMEATDA